MALRIGFIALSGIRAVDQELVQAGLTLPGFLERSQVIASLPSLGLLTLAGMTPSTYTVSYHEVRDLAELTELPGPFDLVALSSFSAQIREAYALADRYRALGTQVVIGGPHVSVLPAEASAHVDAVIIGEGENSWPDVLHDLEAGRLQQQYGRLGEAFDLAQSPMPRIDLLDTARYNRLTVQTSRGCPHRCDFCAATPLMTAGYRQKPQERVLAEIDAIRARWPHPFLEFADDNSFVNRAWWKELMRAMIPRRLRWFTECDISIANDDELLRLMRASGCAQVLIGLEYPDVAPLTGIELRGDWKRRQAGRYLDAIHRIQAHGIAVNGCFILGLDGHDEGCFSRVADFVQESGLMEVQVTILTPFPGTALYARLQQENRLLDPTAWERCTLFDVNFRPSHMTPEALRDGFRSLVHHLYTDELVADRRVRFRSARRATRPNISDTAQ